MLCRNSTQFDRILIRSVTSVLLLWRRFLLSCSSWLSNLGKTRPRKKSKLKQLLQNGHLRQAEWSRRSAIFFLIHGHSRLNRHCITSFLPEWGKFDSCIVFILFSKLWEKTGRSKTNSVATTPHYTKRKCFCTRSQHEWIGHMYAYGEPTLNWAVWQCS